MSDIIKSDDEFFIEVYEQGDFGLSSLGYISYETVKGAHIFKVKTDTTNRVTFKFISSQMFNPNVPGKVSVVAESVLPFPGVYEVRVGFVDKILDPYLKGTTSYNVAYPFVVDRYNFPPTNTNVILYNQVYNIVNGIEEGKIITKNISSRASGLIKEGRIRFGFLGSPVHIFLVFERT